MNGAPSQVDTFDPKPALAKHDGTAYSGGTPVGSNGRPIGHLMRSPFPFTNHGKSGLPISSLFPHTAKFADDLCVIRSLYTDTAAHASGCIQMNTGSVQIGKPSMGAWLTIPAWGPERQPAKFRGPDDRPAAGRSAWTSNWSAGYMPAAYQGTLFRGQGSPLLDSGHALTRSTAAVAARKASTSSATLNENHAAGRPAVQDWPPASHQESAQHLPRLTAADVVDLNYAEECRGARELYGLDDKRTADFGRKCLITRRLLERAGDFVQLSAGGGTPGRGHLGRPHATASPTTPSAPGETDRPMRYDRAT